jgi:nucleoside-diphosphate-sugar epimerase
MNVLMIGGTGFTGPHIAAGLAARGHDVALFHRGRTDAALPAGVHQILCPNGTFADRTFFAEYADELTSFAPEIVVDMIPAVAADARTVIRLFRGIARRVVAISSQDVYRAYGRLLGTETGPPDPVPLSESSPLRERRFPYRGREPRPDDDPQRWLDDYDKIPIEEAYLAQPDLPATILRYPMVYGPRDRQHRCAGYLRRMRAGCRAILLDHALASWRWTRGYVENVAAAAVLAIVDARAAGRTYNLGESVPLSERQWVTRIARAAGWHGEIIAAPGIALPEALRSPMNHAHDLVADTTRIREELGYREAIAPETALARTVGWERDHPPAADPTEADAAAAEEAALDELRDRSDLNRWRV